jgi:superfamily II RNA helicase
MLRVVFSGFNFAIGINMPVKAVIFVDSDASHAMNPSDFVQAAGMV